MEGKKISFGFMKTKKIEKPVIEEEKDYIECVEEKAIKVVGGEKVEEDKPLVIALKPNTMITAEKLRQIAEKVEQSLEETEPKEIKTESSDPPPENETLDQMAVRELLEEAKKEVKVEKNTLTVPIPAKPVLEGDKESTLDDYEAVPVQEFGLAMLRGMGWTPGSEQAKYKQPQLRPKGLGLGADKVIKENQKKKKSTEQEDLAIVKNAFVKITTGKYNGCYGKVVSLDEDMGRVVVDIPVKKETVSLSEFMMHPVTKTEYDKEYKVINADSYEEYKRNESSQKSKHNWPKVQEKEPSSSRRNNDIKIENERIDKRDSEIRRENDNSSNGRNRVKEDRDKSNRRRDSSSSEDRSKSRRKDKKKNRDPSSSSSESERRKNRSHRKKYSSSESEDSDSYRKERRRKSKTPDRKRDIDKKRKGKKKKRDRDRSPHHKKHRK